MLNPEEELPDPSLLAKFRTQRMKEVTLDDVMSEIVRQCVEKGAKEIGIPFRAGPQETLVFSLRWCYHKQENNTEGRYTHGQAERLESI